MPKLVVQDGVLATLNAVTNELVMSVDPALLAKTRQTITESAGVYPAKDPNFGFADYFGPSDPATVGVSMGPYDTWKDTDAVVTLSPRTHRVLTADQANANAVANTLEAITGLDVAVEAGARYKLAYFLPYSAAAVGTGVRWAANGPSRTFFVMRCMSTSSSSTGVFHTQTDQYLSGNNSSGSMLVGNSCLMEITIQPSAAGVVSVMFSSMVANSAITVKAGASVEILKLS